MNQFIFGDTISNSLNAKINLREINKIATEWLHPYYAFYVLGKETVKSSAGLLGASKKTRESYAVAILALSMQEDAGKDFWLHIPNMEPPDGYVVTFQEEAVGNESHIKGKLREVEVVEQLK